LCSCSTCAPKPLPLLLLPSRLWQSGHYFHRLMSETGLSANNIYRSSSSAALNYQLSFVILVLRTCSATSSRIINMPVF
jgi:hypothetical protein